ncbi:MAG: hypothetical protein ACFFD4_17285 [Candidatus Odinarchaeota archaeon]
MSTMDPDFVINSLQLLASLIGAALAIVIGWIVWNKDRKYLLNRCFALGLVCIGVGSFFFGLGSVLLEMAALTTQIFITLTAGAFLFLLIVAITLNSGVVAAERTRNMVMYAGLFIIAMIAIWAPGSVYLVGPGNIEMSTQFMMIIYPMAGGVFAAIIYQFTRVYWKATNKKAKKTAGFFLLGLVTLAGALVISLLSNVLQNRWFDLLGTLAMSLGIAFMGWGFREPAKDE